MKASTKAAFLSAFVFPGVGQVSLRFYRRGLVLAAVTLAALATLVVSAVRSALEILRAIEARGEAVDVTVMSQEASRAVSDISSYTISISFLVIFGCWVFGVVDAWLLGTEADGKRSINNRGNADKSTLS